MSVAEDLVFVDVVRQRRRRRGCEYVQVLAVAAARLVGQRELALPYGRVGQELQVAGGRDLVGGGERSGRSPAAGVHDERVLAVAGDLDPTRGGALARDCV